MTERVLIAPSRPAPSHPGSSGQWSVASPSRHSQLRGSGGIAPPSRTFDSRLNCQKQRTRRWWKGKSGCTTAVQSTTRLAGASLEAASSRGFLAGLLTPAFPEGTPSHPLRLRMKPPGQWLFVPSNAVTVAGPRWPFTSFPFGQTAPGTSASSIRLNACVKGWMIIRRILLGVGEVLG